MGSTVEIAKDTSITQVYDFMNLTFFNAKEPIEAYWNRCLQTTSHQAMIG